MDLFGLRFLEHVHGHLGILSVALLAHPAIVLRREGRRAHLAVALAAIVPALTGALGAYLYPPYRELLKQHIFIESPALGYAFERKEHLAFGAIALALAGACAYIADQKTPAKSLWRAAHLAFCAAFSLSFVAALLGVWVAAHKTF